MSKIAAKCKSLSGDELYLISRAELEKRKLITTECVKKVLGMQKKATNIPDRLSRNGIH